MCVCVVCNERRTCAKSSIQISERFRKGQVRGTRTCVPFASGSGRLCPVQAGLPRPFHLSASVRHIVSGASPARSRPRATSQRNGPSITQGQPAYTRFWAVGRPSAAPRPRRFTCKLYLAAAVGRFVPAWMSYPHHPPCHCWRVFVAQEPWAAPPPPLPTCARSAASTPCWRYCSTRTASQRSRCGTRRQAAVTPLSAVSIVAAEG